MLRLPLSGQTAVVTGGAWEEGLSAAEDLERLRRALDVNVLGAYVCMRRFAPDMVGRGTGSIVNTSTNVATQRSPRHLPYGPSKAFIEAFSLAAAEQLAGSGVASVALPRLWTC